MNTITQGIVTQAQEIAFLHAVIIFLLLIAALAIAAAVLALAIVRGIPQRLHERTQQTVRRHKATWGLGL